MNAEILSIGDELLIGQVTNTNATYLGEQLSLLGITVRRITTIGDNIDTLQQEFRRAWQDHDIVISTGGLGPTHDDVTREAFSNVFHMPLVEHDLVLDDITRFLSERRRPVTAANRDQAMVPAGAEIIRNRNGTAPGYYIHQDMKHFFVVPGVPHEMTGMVASFILPRLLKSFRNARASTTVLTTGIPESTLAELLGEFQSHCDGCSVAYLPSTLGVRVRLTAIDPDQERAAERIAAMQAHINERAGEFVFGTDHDRLEAVVLNLLTDTGKSIAVAESCTGGLITDRITDVPGSSRCFDRGVVAYSNKSKIETLGVDPRIIETHGAVSRQTAEAMAAGVRRLAGSSIGISTTGIAGPDGGTTSKPVGLVWIGIAEDAGTQAFEYYFGNDRIRCKQRSTQAALDTVRRALLRLPLQPTTIRSQS